MPGALVVGEATADLGGLTLAYRAYHAFKTYLTTPVITGLPTVQQFFLGAAHIWSTNIRQAQARNLITIAPHPPTKYLVNDAPVNMPKFKAAFGLAGPMVTKQRCAIW